MTEFFTDDQVEEFAKLIPADCNAEDRARYLHLIKRTGLDPLARQVYLLPRRNRMKNGGYELRHITVTGIDGYRLIADRTGKLAGRDKNEYDMDGDKILAAHVTIYKMVEGVRCGFTATAQWSEYNANQGMWKSMPKNQIAKCAEAAALRMGFPADFSGIYVIDELDQDRSVSSGVETSAGPGNTPASDSFDPAPGEVYDGFVTQYSAPGKNPETDRRMPGAVTVALTQEKNGKTLTAEKKVTFFQYPPMVDAEALDAAIAAQTPVQFSFKTNTKGTVTYENLNNLVISENVGPDAKQQLKELITIVADKKTVSFETALSMYTGLNDLDEVDGMFGDEVADIVAEVEKAIGSGHTSDTQKDPESF
jgi:phage recombination protein Bet